ncbi:hypothetical protein SNE40_020999 [Patella caerulea]|uniref:DUF7042 domain-containing protein n=1 Tax=Patella caerulea TaxID=87958 RepID=A0AAN8G9J8_PATCE
MKNYFYVLFVCFLVWKKTSGTCTLPTDLVGTWMSSSKGSIAFTSSSSISGYPISNFGLFDFNCTDSYGTKLVLKSSAFSYLGLQWEAYLCLDLTSVSSYLYTYYLGSVPETDAQNERVKIFVLGVNPSASTVCDRTDSNDIGTYDVLLKNDSTSAMISCPTSLQAYWSYTIDSGNGTDCVNDSYLDVCSDDKTLSFNYTRCNSNVGYSAEGSLSCLHESTNGTSSYLTLYNNDNNTDEATTYRFTCLVYEVTSIGVSMTQYPRACLTNQTTQSVTSPGATILLSNKVSCPTTVEVVASASLSWVYAVVGLLVLILLIFVGIGAYKAWKKYGESADGLRGVKVDKEPFADKVDGPSPEGEDVPQDVLTLLEKENSLPTEAADKSGDVHLTITSPMPSSRDAETPGPHPGEIPGSVVDYHTVGGISHPSSPKPGKNVKMSPRTPRGGIVPKGSVSPLGNKPSPRTPQGATVKPLKAKSLLVKSEGPATSEMARGRRLPPISENSAGSKLKRSQTTKSGKWKPGQKGTVTPVTKKSETEKDQRRNSITSITSRESADSSTGARPKSRSVSFRQDVEAKKRAKRLRSQNSSNPMEDDDQYLPPNIAPIKITRVDIPALSHRASESDMKIQEIDSSSTNYTKQLVWSTGQEVDDSMSAVKIRKVWLEPEDPTEEIWAKVSSLWRIGQTWMDRTVNL